MARRLNINTAPATDLMKLPGIGNAMALKIIRHREMHGPFTGKRDLLAISGFSERMLAALLDRIALSTVSGQASHPPSSPEVPPTGSLQVSSDTPEAEQPETSSSGPEESSSVPEDFESAPAEVASDAPGGAPGPVLSNKQIRKLARRVKLAPRVVQTLFSTFEGQPAFIKSGKPAITFDGRAFWYQLKTRGIRVKSIAKKHPRVLHKKEPSKYPMKGKKEYLRLVEAKHIHANAAIAATAYGMFELKGVHYKKAGYKKPAQFEKGQADSIEQQLADFLNVILSRKMFRALKKKDWDAFALLYHGPGRKRKAEARLFRKVYRSLGKKKNA